MSLKSFRKETKKVTDAFLRGDLTNRPSPIGLPGRISPQTIIDVKNATDSAVFTGDYMAISGPLFAASSVEEFFRIDLANGPCFKGAAPEGDNPVLAFALESIPSGAIGRCTVGGVVIPTRCSIQKEYHQFADYMDGQIKSGLAGPHRIIAKPTGSGYKWCYVNLNSGWTDASYWGMLKIALAAGTNQSATVTLTIPGTTETEDVTAYTFPGFPVKATAIGKAVYVKFHPLDRKWYFVLIDC